MNNTLFRTSFFTPKKKLIAVLTCFFLFSIQTPAFCSKVVSTEWLTQFELSSETIYANSPLEAQTLYTPIFSSAVKEFLNKASTPFDKLAFNLSDVIIDFQCSPTNNDINSLHQAQYQCATTIYSNLLRLAFIQTKISFDFLNQSKRTLFNKPKNLGISCDDERILKSTKTLFPDSIKTTLIPTESHHVSECTGIFVTPAEYIK